MQVKERLLSLWKYLTRTKKLCSRSKTRIFSTFRSIFRFCHRYFSAIFSCLQIANFRESAKALNTQKLVIVEKNNDSRVTAIVSNPVGSVNMGHRRSYISHPGSTLRALNFPDPSLLDSLNKSGSPECRRITVYNSWQGSVVKFSFALSLPTHTALDTWIFKLPHVSSDRFLAYLWAFKGKKNAHCTWQWVTSSPNNVSTFHVSLVPPSPCRLQIQI